MNSLDVVVGAQFGSEGKGHVTAQIVKRHHRSSQKVINIRVAGPNAGHTVIDAAGLKYPLRTIPVGAAISDQVICYIAPGSEIDLDVLTAEADDLHGGGHQVNLVVHREATILTAGHKGIEANRHMHEKIGSTGKGIGACRADRIMRTALRVADDEVAIKEIGKIGGLIVGDEWLDSMLSNNSNLSIVVEGTQGYGLGLHAGHYPQCTSSDTRAIDFLAMAGISPWDRRINDFQVWAIARVYPIRVAGNSGPLEGETTWQDLGLDEEYTTVTHKVRRVGQWDPTLIRDAVTANGGPGSVVVALTMVDQKVPEISNVGTDSRVNVLDLDTEAFGGVVDLIRQVQGDAGVPVAMITTGPSTAIWL